MRVSWANFCVSTWNNVWSIPVHMPKLLLSHVSTGSNSKCNYQSSNNGWLWGSPFNHFWMHVFSQSFTMTYVKLVYNFSIVPTVITEPYSILHKRNHWRPRGKNFEALNHNDHFLILANGIKDPYCKYSQDYHDEKYIHYFVCCFW